MAQPDERFRSDLVLLSYYIKFNRLQELTPYMGIDETTSVVDIYIDLYDMLKRLYGSDLYANKSLTIVSSIINLAAHMRAYYKTRHGMWTRIFLIYADELNDNQRQFWPNMGINDYTNTLNYNTIHHMVLSQLQLVKILAGYIPDVYFVPKHSCFSVVAFNLITKNYGDYYEPTSIILSKSRYNYQIVGMLGKHKVFQFRPCKFNRDDMSVLVTPQNAILSYYYKLSPTGTNITKIKEISPELMSILWSLNGCEPRNVSTAVNIKRSINMIHDAIVNYRINNCYNSDPDFVYNNLVSVSNSIDIDTFRYRFQALDLVYQHRIYANSPESLDSTWYINLQDPNTVKELNNKYFADNPLDLGNL